MKKTVYQFEFNVAIECKFLPYDTGLEEFTKIVVWLSFIMQIYFALKETQMVIFTTFYWKIATIRCGTINNILDSNYNFTIFCGNSYNSAN